MLQVTTAPNCTLSINVRTGAANNRHVCREMKRHAGKNVTFEVCGVKVIEKVIVNKLI